MNLYGMRIVVHPDVPKMQLSTDCPVTPEFRAEINRWMVEFFGTTNLMKDGEIFCFGDVMTANPRTVNQLRQTLLNLPFSSNI